jgi:HTH-like domain
VKTIADALGAARSNLAVQASAALPARRRGRPAKPETQLLSEIDQIIAGQPSYGYRRVHALVRRCRHEQGGAAVNVKRVYRIMTSCWMNWTASLSVAATVSCGTRMTVTSTSAVKRLVDGSWRA